MSEESLGVPVAVPLGMVICDSIARDLVTGKVLLNGLFGAIVAGAVPARANFMAYATMTAVRKSVVIHFEIRDVDANVVQRGPDTPLEKPADPIVEAIAMALFQVDLPAYGEYFVTCLADGQDIMERRLMVIEPSPPPKPEDTQ